MNVQRLIAPWLSLTSTISTKNMRYRSKLRASLIKNSNYDGSIDNHHIIPQQFCCHSVISELEFDIHGSENIIMLPNKYMSKRFHIVHRGPHKQYNNYVKCELDSMQGLSGDELRYQFWLFFANLASRINDNDMSIPW
jgi:hypothetical protein